MRLPFPVESGLELKRFSPTAITIADNGEIYLSDGYASNYIFVFGQDGKYLRHFGKKGNGMTEFNTAHGMTLDTRYEPNRLLICDRNHQPKGRLLHYDLDGNFIGEVITGLGMPTSVSIMGEFVSVPDLHGRLVILDKSNTIIAVLGNNPDRKQGRNFKVPQSDWIEGDLQWYARVLLGQARESVRSGLECFGPPHETRPRENGDELTAPKVNT